MSSGVGTILYDSNINYELAQINMSEDSTSHPSCHRCVKVAEMSIPFWPSELLVLALGGLNPQSLLLEIPSMD